jgi:small-conductance mechanosensitive channel
MISNYTKILYGKLETWAETAIGMLPNFVLAVIILIAFYFIAKLGKKLINKLLNKWYNNEELTRIFSKVAYVAILVVGTLTALNVVNLDETVTSLLAGAGIIGLALAFAFQDIAANFVSGIFMAAKGPFEVEQIVEVNDVMGIVKAINLRTTEILTFDGNTVIIPNKEIFQSNIINFQKTKKRRVTIEVGVSYDDDLKKAKDAAIAAVKEIPYILEDEEVLAFYKEFGGSSINFEIRFWVPYDQQPQFLEGRSEAIMRIKEAFDKENLTIPFPITTLDFGIKGGEKLDEVLHLEPNEDKEDIKKAS